MIYKQFKELQLSTLGMGNMRLPVKGEQGPIDEAKARAIIEYAYENGINYFDTAYRYHAGESEKLVGKVLSQYPRDSWYLATKMPGHQMQYRNGKLEFIGYLTGLQKPSVTDIFEEQLEKCGVDYFDFYLLHNLCETSYDFYTDEDLGVVEYLLKQKEAGRIRHLGFSAHGRAETIDRFLNWKNCFEFAQIQLNYLDWTLQEAGKKYEVLSKHGLPIIVMEPLRGGRLANLNEKANQMLLNARPEVTIASWAFRYLQSLPNVQTVLSGMSTLEQLKENIEIFSTEDKITENESKILKEAIATMVNLIPCTACRYCCDGCPQGLEIPKLISMYNESTFGNPAVLKFTLGGMKDAELPSACINCGSCRQLCPQEINIPEIMSKFDAVVKSLK